MRTLPRRDAIADMNQLKMLQNTSTTRQRALSPAPTRKHDTEASDPVDNCTGTCLGATPDGRGRGTGVGE